MSELQYGLIPELERRLEQQSITQDSENAGELAQPRLLRNKVTAEEIAEVVGKWTGIPVARLLSQEKERLLHLEQSLGERVIGQAEPIAAVSQAVRAPELACRIRVSQMVHLCLGQLALVRLSPSRSALRQPRGHGSGRYVGVYGKALGSSADCAPPGYEGTTAVAILRGREAKTVFLDFARR